MRYLAPFFFGALVRLVNGHDGHHDQIPLDYVRFPQPIFHGSSEGKTCTSYSPCSLLRSWSPSLVTADSIFSGITTFAKLPWVQCLTKEQHVAFDIAFIGAPFVRVAACMRLIYALIDAFLGHWNELQARS